MSRYEDARRSGRDDRKRSASGPQSPPRKRKPIAADYFEAEKDQHRLRVDDRPRHGGHSSHGAREGRDSHDDDYPRTRKHHHRHHHRQGASSSKRENHDPAALPLKARPLSYKHDLDAFEPLFANYLDIQKGKDFYGMDGHEQKGRWKSFVYKWNRGELAEGWYDPEMFERITKEASARPDARRRERPVVREAHRGDFEREDRDASAEDQEPQRREARGDREDEDDDYGPPPPPGALTNSSRKGPGIPSLSDLALRREAAAEDRLASAADLRLARKADRIAQKEALDDLVPRAEPGTRERKLEKKAAVNEKMRSFRDKGDAIQEVADGDLMGGGDGVEEFKQAVANQQRKKTDRELRREEEARARFEEREEKLREWREREEEKMRGLKELAKARFG